RPPRVQFTSVAPRFMRIGGLIERKLLSDADLIAIELQPKPWPNKSPVLALSTMPATDALMPAPPEVMGDIRALRARLTEWTSPGAGRGEGVAKRFRQDVVEALARPRRGCLRSARCARATLPRDTISTCDAGASRLL